MPTNLLKRHPLIMEAHFDFVLVLTYALPSHIMAPLLPPGLELDTFGDLAFIAVALVQTRGMKVRAAPRLFAQDYVLVGYRLFVRFQTASGPRLRGLKILRSDTDKSSMAMIGNLLTHYHFYKCDIHYTKKDSRLNFECRSAGGISDLAVSADLTAGGEILPAGSPFSSVKEALKFAGPMPFTFDYEKETNSIIRVEGVRQNWHPKTVAVDVSTIKFLEQEPFCQGAPLLCSAFYIENIPYYWKPGISEIITSHV